MNRRRFIKNIGVATSTMIVGGSLANELVKYFKEPKGYLWEINKIDKVEELYSTELSFKSIFLDAYKDRGSITVIYPQDDKIIKPYGNLNEILKDMYYVDYNPLSDGSWANES